jgi:hypothetical protein
VSSVVLIYTSARALRVALTYDEAATYLLYVSSDVLSVFSFGVATNHFLNTLLARAFAAAGGTAELVLRLPALAGHVLYLAFALRLTRTFAPGVVGLGGFLLLNLNPYLLDYFALCRGYGLALGLQMGAIYYLIRAIADEPSGSAPRDLAVALWLAAAAAVANFSLLTVYLAFWVVALALLVCQARRRRPPMAGPASRVVGRPSGWLLMGILVALVFNVLVVSQDLELSEQLYLPVAVRIVGVSPEATAGVVVSRIDSRQRSRPMPFHDGMWRSERPVHFNAVRVELPLGASSIQALDVFIGTRVFHYDEAALASMTASRSDERLTVDVGDSLSSPRSRVPAFRRVINWRGDLTYAWQVAARSLLVVSLLGGLAVLLHVCGRALVSARWLEASQWRALTASTLALASLSGYPLYLLRRNGELFFGGTRDFLHDTLFSIVDASFYGKTYHPDQATIVAGVVALTVLAYLGLVCWPRRRGSATAVVPAGIVLAVMALSAVGAVVQRALFDTPLPIGRTAIFYIPLYAVFLTLLLQCLREAGPLARLLPVPVLGVLVALALVHLAGTANLSRTFDWRRDADTKTMVADLHWLVARGGPMDRKVSLGIDWFYYPVVLYYLQRNDLTGVEIHFLPSPAAHDFLYVGGTRGIDTQQVIRVYPGSGSVLARPR